MTVHDYEVTLYDEIPGDYSTSPERVVSPGYHVLTDDDVVWVPCSDPPAVDDREFIVHYLHVARGEREVRFAC